MENQFLVTAAVRYQQGAKFLLCSTQDQGRIKWTRAPGQSRDREAL